jgi:hypothetical protein
MGIDGQTHLTDLEKVHVAIAYNAGKFIPSKGLKQGHKSDGKFYGEFIFDFLRLAQTVSIPSIPAPIPAPAPGTAPVTPPAPVTSTGDLLQVDVRENPLLLRSEPRIPMPDRNANVIARLPDGHPRAGSWRFSLRERWGM